MRLSKIRSLNAEGMSACIRGLERNANPYPEHQAASRAWDVGYMRASAAALTRSARQKPGRSELEAKDEGDRAERCAQSL